MAKRSLCLLLAGIALYCAAPPAFAATVIVPTDQPTVQGAVNAAGPGGTVIINSNAIFNETVIVTRALTIHGGVGFTPTIRGTGMCGPTSIVSCTLLFTPNSDAAQMLAVSDVRFLPKSGARASGPGVIRIFNRGAGEASAIFTNCTIENPEGFGYLAVDIRRTSCSAGLNHVSFHGGSISISGVDESFAGAGAFEMAEGGSLEVSNFDLAMSGIDAHAFTLFGTPSACGGITFTLNDSNIIVGPASPGFNTDIGVLLFDVTATLARNTFQMVSNSEASASGISAGGGTGQQFSGSITLDANHFFGSGPDAGLAVRAAPFANGAIVVNATNNVVHSMQEGFALGQNVGNPAGALTATLANNTVERGKMRRPVANGC